MKSYEKEVEVIWADMDPNQHMRHTSYSQYAAHTRISFFAQQGFPLQDLAKKGLGAILLREQSTYIRETQMHEKLSFNMLLKAATADYTFYTIEQEIRKENGKLAAKVLIDGSWIDMQARKITAPWPDLVAAVIDELPRHKDFEWKEPTYYRFK